MRTKIEVTQECIDKGVKSVRNGCPVALAIQNATNDEAVEVDCISGAVIHTDNFDLPDKASTFIFNFDNGAPVEPFSFVIDIPKKYLKQ